MSIRVLILILFSGDFLIGQEPVDAKINGLSPEICNNLPCTMEFWPVCGSNGKTYSNECLLKNAAICDPSIKLAKEGRCEERKAIGRCSGFCTYLLMPVCASNGKTYPNQCVLEAAACSDPSIKLVKQGECGEISKRCNNPCHKIIRPVCGSDGKTYSNDCILENASCLDPSIKLDYEGKCDPLRKSSFVMD